MASRVHLLVLFARICSIACAIGALEALSSDDASRRLHCAVLEFSSTVLFVNITDCTVMVLSQVLVIMYFGAAIRPMPEGLLPSMVLKVTDWFLTISTYGIGFASLFVTLYLKDRHNFEGIYSFMPYVVHSILTCFSGAFTGLVLLCDYWIAFQMPCGVHP